MSSLRLAQTVEAELRRERDEARAMIEELRRELVEARASRRLLTRDGTPCSLRDDVSPSRVEAGMSSILTPRPLATTVQP